MIQKIKDQILRIWGADAGKPRKKVAIIGAGMAGLAAAYELTELGHKVVIYEGSQRVGGRAWTHRFRDGQYHEFGAMRFPVTHDYTRHYAEICGLNFRKFYNHHDDGDASYYFKGVLSRHKDWDLKLIPELKLTDREKWIIANGPIPPVAKEQQLINLLAYPLSEIIGEIESSPNDQKALLGEDNIKSEKISELDKVSLGGYLRRYLTSQDALDLIGMVTGLEVFWDRAVTFLIREEIVARERLKLMGMLENTVDEIIGGTDLLPGRMAELLAEKKVNVQYGKVICGVKNQRDNIQLCIQEKDRTKTLVDFEHVICTLPFSILRQIELSGISDGKMRAIRNLEYTSSVKVLLNTKNRFWETEHSIFGGASQSDLLNRQIYYPSDNVEATTTGSTSYLKSVAGQFDIIADKKVKDFSVSEGPGVLVGTYTWGQDARRIGALSNDMRIDTIVQNVSRIHPEILEEGMVKDGASMYWDAYKFSSGAFCFLKPGDFTNYFFDSIKPEGQLYFAGEHCSIDPGWIQGALTSSLSAVEALVK